MIRSRKSEASHGLDLINPAQIRHVSHIAEELHRARSSGRPAVTTLQAEAMLKATTSAYEITSVSPTLIDNNDLVSVSFATDNPQPSDWIAAYSPPDVDISRSAPVKFGACVGRDAESYLQSGIGTLQFNLTNLRAGVRFYYFTNGLEEPVLVANSSLSQAVYFRNTNEPLRNRVLPTGDPDVLMLLWSSHSSAQPLLQWGTQRGVYTHEVPAVSYSFSVDEMCGGTASSTGWRDPGLIHAANFTGVLYLNLDNTDLVYRFGDKATDDFSEEFTFHVPPRAGSQPPHRPTTVVVMGDLGVGSTDSSFETQVWDEPCPPAINTTMSISARVAKGEIDAVFLTGDISYANGYISTWDFFLDMISPMAGASLFLTTVGNHESDWPGTSSLPFYWGYASGGECSVASLKYLPMPAPASVQQPWWSYDVGLIHFVGMSTEHNYTVGSPQYRFIERDLQRVNRTRTPWIVFSGHRPFYVNSASCCANYGDYSCTECVLGSDVSDMQQLQAHIEPLLRKYRVNLGFTGHFHDMERQAAVFQNETVQHSKNVKIDGVDVAWQENPKATVWMVVGAAGNGPSIPTRKYKWNEKYWESLWGYAVISAVNATYLQWQLVNSATNEVVDILVITQDGSSWESLSDDSSSSSSSLLGLPLAAGIAVVTLIVLLGLLAVVGASFLYSRRRSTSQEEQQNLMIGDKKEVALSRSV